MAAAATKSEKDLELLKTVWRTLKEPPQVDYQAMVDAGLYKTPESARVSFYNFSKRIGLSNDASPRGSGNTAGGAGASKKKPPTTARKRKARSSEDTTGGNEDAGVLGAEETPKKQKMVKEEPLVDGRDGDGGGGAGDEDIVKKNE